jgi:hypothetical protein
MRTVGAMLLSIIFVLGVVFAHAQTTDPLSDAAAQMAQKFTQAAETKKGQVVAVDNDTIPPTIYVLLGTKDGIFKDQLLDVVANGDPIKVGDRVIGYKRKPVGTAQITDVQDEVTIAQMKDLVAGQKPAEGNVASLRTVPGSLAVAMLLRPAGAGCQIDRKSTRLNSSHT